MKNQTINDTDRAEWVNNDEGLYRWWKSERGSLRAFVRAHRAEIDATINARNHGDNWGPVQQSHVPEFKRGRAGQSLLPR